MPKENSEPKMQNPEGFEKEAKEEPEEEIEEPKEELEEEPEEVETKIGALTSPEGVLMLSIAIILDSISLICVILILLFGIGLVLAKIVYFVGLFLILGWAFIRGGSIPTPQKGKLKQKMMNYFGEFLKRHWKKKVAGLIPAIGDALPQWTWIVYSELTKG